MLLCWGVRIDRVTVAAGYAARGGKDTLGLIPRAWSAWMASITAYLTPAAIDAIPYFQRFCTFAAKLRKLRRHHFGRRIGLGDACRPFWFDFNRDIVGVRFDMGLRWKLVMHLGLALRLWI